ncbi:MAG TPA: SURF1 family cytochrome oxidase biogenesis protein [Pseudolysinimonas sp.]|nr:SURF1 family cytochrome oxidase biogenesis protein [Pseudolysinimonas sp.]
MTDTPGPGFWAIARRPQWIAALLLALAIAAGFSALGQWQLARSVASAPVDRADTETPIELTSLAEPGTTVTGTQLGRKVTVTGQLVDGDFVVLSNRLNGGVAGFWLVGHVSTEGGADLAVALGWAPTRARAVAAEASAAIASPLIGRYLPSEPPDQPDVDKGVQSAASVPALINQWAQFSGSVYGGYLVADQPAAGLETIDSPAPSQEVSLNWLNVFYAAEWAIFAGFAIYLWYRLVKDVVEKEADPSERRMVA